MTQIKRCAHSKEAYQHMKNEFARVFTGNYEDARLSRGIKMIWLVIWLCSIPAGFCYGTDGKCLLCLASMSALLLINVCMSVHAVRRWLDILTLVLLIVPTFYIYLHGGIGRYSVMYLLLFGCGSVFILGVRDSLLINVLLLFHIFIDFTIRQDSVARSIYGENIAMRFPYLFICIVLISYCLMFAIERYWSEKREQSRILEERIRREQKKLNNMSMRVMNTMVHALGAKIPGKEEHGRCVAEYSRRLAELLGYDADICTDAYQAGLLHELGMIGIPDALIKTEDLTDAQYEVFKTYADKGYQIIHTLQSADSDRIAQAVRYHREAYDGSGFPDGLCGDAIPQLARILAVADYTDRHIRRGETLTAVMDQLEQFKGSLFDPVCVDGMLRLLSGKNTAVCGWDFPPQFAASNF